MSSIRLLKDHERGKRGTVISVPFGLGAELIAAGIGERPGPVPEAVAEIQAAPVAVVSTPAAPVAAPPAPPVLKSVKADHKKPNESGHGGQTVKP